MVLLQEYITMHGLLNVKFYSVVVARLHRSSHIRSVLVVRPREMQFITAVLARQLLRLVCLAGSVQTFATLATAALRMTLWLRVQRTSCNVILSPIATSLLPNWKNSHDTAGLSTAYLSCNCSPKLSSQCVGGGGQQSCFGKYWIQISAA